MAAPFSLSLSLSLFFFLSFFLLLWRRFVVVEENAETGNIFPVEIEKLLLTAEEERREEERREEKKKRKDCAVYLVLGQPLRGREPA